MGKYLKLFENHSDYEDYMEGGDVLLPNVSYCEDQRSIVHFNPKINYKKRYFTTTVREPGSVYFLIPVEMDTSAVASISYSVDDGATWTTVSNDDNKQSPLEIEVDDLAAGDSVLWKGDATIFGSMVSSDPLNKSCNIYSEVDIDLSGNIMSLLYEDDFEGQNEIEVEFCFYGLFRNSITIVSAKNLVLPATILNDNCYDHMFYGCSSLTTAPSILPATILAESCYSNMFIGCSSLTTAPELPATTLANYCYTYMFSGCSSLITAPELPAIILAEGCYGSMFSGCSSLTTAPELPATTLANYCYTYMFSGCSSLTTAPELPAINLNTGCYSYMFRGCTMLTAAPELPATNLAEVCYSNMFRGTNVLPDCSNIDFTSQTVVASRGLHGLFAGTKVTDTDLQRILPKNSNENYWLPVTTLAASCYSNMFQNCTSLTTSPELPATTLATTCYNSMFDGCASLEKAPELPATTLAQGCYSFMFRDCSRLNYIKALFTTTPTTSYTQNWVYGVAASGTFVKNSSATWNVTGDSGVPSGWTIETNS